MNKIWLKNLLEKEKRKHQTTILLETWNIETYRKGNNENKIRWINEAKETIYFSEREIKIIDEIIKELSI